MFDRVSLAVRSRLLQGHQIASWRRLKLSKQEVDDCIAIRRVGTSIFTVTGMAIEDLPPKGAGLYFSVLHKCTVILAIFLLGSPTPHEVTAFLGDLKYYFSLRCSQAEIDVTALVELAGLTREYIQLQCNTVPEYTAALVHLSSPDCTDKQICEAWRMTRQLTTRLMLAVFHESLPKLREEYSFKDMLAFTRSFRREGMVDDSDEIPSLQYRTIEYNVDNTEVEYEGVGERIQLSAFCKPLDSVSDKIKCSVCMTETNTAVQDQDSQAVETQCGHVFHKLCLDKWVNESGMKASNTCPSCRTVLCSPRERLHASVEASAMNGSDEEQLLSSPEVWSINSVSTSSRSRIRWLEARIAAHVDSDAGDWEDNELSDNDGFSIASNISSDALPASRVFVC